MIFTAKELHVSESYSQDYEKGESFTCLQGDDGEWYELVPGKSINNLSSDDVRLVQTSENSKLVETPS